MTLILTAPPHTHKQTKLKNIKMSPDRSKSVSEHDLKHTL